MELKDIQIRFADALLSKDNQQEIEALCINPCSRIAIYRSGLEAIWAQTLANAYPVMQELVGAEFFALLAGDYGRQFPSQSGDLNAFGADFPQFLRETKTVADFPYFPAVAELEWLIHRAYYAADAQSLGLAEFLSSVGDAAQESQLIFHPAAALHQSPWASAAVWQAHQSDEVRAPDGSLNKASFAVACRPEWQVALHPLSRASFEALRALRDGQSLGQALDLAMTSDANFDVAGELQNWFGFGVFSGYRCKEMAD